MIGRRSVLGAAALAGACGAIGVARAASSRVRMGYIGDFQNTSLPAIAVDQKMWQAEGLEPDLRVFTNGPIQIQAMGAGSLDFGAIGPGALWLPASGRTKVVAINLLTFSDRLLGQPGINSVQDLKGKKVGVPPGTSGEMILRLTLAKAGMSVADINLVPMDYSTLVAAFTSGQVAGAGLNYPMIDTVKKRMPNLVELSKSADFYPAYSFPNVFVARNETVEGDAALVTRFVRVMKKAMDYRVADIPRAVRITAKFLGVEPDALTSSADTNKLLSSQELVKLTEDGTADKWFEGLNGMFKSFGTLPDPLPPARFYEGKAFVAA
jgi:NitT/TauT family transport system substrate-binding protein